MTQEKTNSTIDPVVFKNVWLDPSLTVPQACARAGVTVSYAYEYASKLGLPTKRRAVRQGGEGDDSVPNYENASENLLQRLKRYHCIEDVRNFNGAPSAHTG